MLSVSAASEIRDFMRLIFVFSLGTILLAPAPARGAVEYELSGSVPPKPTHEFRGVWIATVANTDWPSRAGLSTAAQKAELRAILDRAVQLKLNAVIFQVRPQCDALYASAIEPWSEYLTGTMGRAPEPYYDPLAYAIAEAHKHGLELHAWFNPYRALHSSHKGTVAANHISRTHPELVRKLNRREGAFLWLDPGERRVQDYSLSVVMDVVKRYDVDGVQFDDYFYLAGQDSAGKDLDFPDESSWRKYGAAGDVSRADWRRENVNAFIARVYHSIKATKPWVKFGVSPHGIWRPGFPAQIKGTDAYADLYADSRKWLADGWVDYLAPQLYWPRNPREQSFSALLNWWSEQNAKHRHLWPGIAAYRASQWPPDEIESQIQLTRQAAGVSGYILYNASSLAQNTTLDAQLAWSVNTGPVLVPASPWLGNGAPAAPTVSVSGGMIRLKLNWTAGGTNSAVRWWLVQTKLNGDWKTELLHGNTSSRSFVTAPEIFSVTAVDRAGNLSAPTVLQVKKSPPPAPAPKKATKKKAAPKRY